MLQPARLGYVAFDVADLEASTRFYEDVVHLEVVNRNDDTVYLRGTTEHHWMVLRQSRTPGFNRVAYEMPDEQALEEIEQKIKSAGIEVTHGGDLLNDGVDRYIRFHDPEGLHVELFVNMLSLPVPPVPRHYVRLEKLVHVGFGVKDVQREHSFYHDVIGFRDSDWMERSGVFMHCGDRFHHSLVLGSSPSSTRPTIQHMCIQVSSMDDVMRARNVVLDHEIPFRRDLGRHMASGSWGFYFLDQANHYAVEFCREHRQVEVPGHRARVLPRMVETGDVWRVVNPLDRSHPILIDGQPRTVASGKAAHVNGGSRAHSPAPAK